VHAIDEQFPPPQFGAPPCALQAFPHFPQFAGSTAVCVSHPSVDAFLQSSQPAAHDPIAHAPAVHVAAAFAKLQGSQDATFAQPYAGSVSFTHLPAHAFSSAAQLVASGATSVA